MNALVRRRNGSNVQPRTVTSGHLLTYHFKVNCSVFYLWLGLTTTECRYSIHLPRRDGRLSWPRLPNNAPAGSRTGDLSLITMTSHHPQNDTTSWYAIIFTPSPIHRGTGYCFRSISFFVYLYLCFFVGKITRKRLDRFAWNFQRMCGVTMGRPDYIFGQFRETARYRDDQYGTGFIVLSHHSLFYH